MQFKLSNFLGSLVSIPACISIEAPLNTVSTLLHAPKLLTNAYRTLFATKRIGPNLKFLSGVLIPPAFVISLGATTIVSTVFGVYRGIAYGSDNPIKAIGKSFADCKDFWTKYLSKSSDFFASPNLLDLPEGSKPFDIRFLDAVKAAGVALTSIPFNTVIPAVQGSVFACRFIPKAYRILFEEMFKNEPLIALLALVLSPLLFLLVPFVSLLGAMSYGLYQTATTTYQQGLRQGLLKLFSGVSKTHEITQGILAKED